ncbi:IclR family transcriptional regulator [Cryobacterium glaciale]|uniref:IclR family transcriptional regulator n=1 Tax=Cryobacterium glaciale TaxID=1259145 RepID=A0A4R8UW69_9MICO|nr:IclR family transcriptional regulator [Cryobacterium glaciale]TFB72747.1 IclR family transcriptional regulator [Cryobacterium glaciale]
MTSNPAEYAINADAPAPPPAAAHTTDYMIGPVAAALDIMLEFENGQRELRVADIARRIGVTRNKAFRLIKTLESRGFLQRMGDHYRVGSRLLTLGEVAAKPIEALRAAAQPELQALQVQTNETVYLITPVGNEAICISRIESTHSLRISVDVGAKRPLDSGAGQKMLLSGQDEQRLAQVLSHRGPAFTEHTITDESELRHQLDEIRQRGYSLSLGEVDAGAGAVAAPVYDYSGVMIAALVIGGAMARVSANLDGVWKELVVSAAHRISVTLGFQDK